jgi:O-methyltransferase
MPLKAWLRKNRKILGLYHRLYFLLSIPVKDLAMMRKIRLILRVQPYTMLRYRRLSALYDIGTHLESKRIDGSFVECGAWNGGSAGLVAKLAEHNGNRHIWLFDSWEGLPEPTSSDVTYEGQCGEKGMALGFEGKVRELMFEKLKLSKHRVHLVKGWFQNTIRPHKRDIGEIALLHLDCDFYESVKLCLEELYEKVSEGGFVVIDDYGYWKGCKKAVDEFIEKQSSRIKLRNIDYSAVCFRRLAK